MITKIKWTFLSFHFSFGYLQTALWHQSNSHCTTQYNSIMNWMYFAVYVCRVEWAINCYQLHDPRGDGGALKQVVYLATCIKLHRTLTTKMKSAYLACQPGYASNPSVQWLEPVCRRVNLPQYVCVPL